MNPQEEVFALKDMYVHSTFGLQLHPCRWTVSDSSSFSLQLTTSERKAQFSSVPDEIPQEPSVKALPDTFRRRMARVYIASGIRPPRWSQ